MSGRRDDALERFERAVEGPLLVLAALMVPLLVVPLFADLSPGTRRAFVAADWLIWGVFAFEFTVRLGLARSKRVFLRQAWPDLLVVALPVLRPLRLIRTARAARLLRLARLGTFLGAAAHFAARLLVRHRLHYALLGALIAVVAAASLMLYVEQDAPGSSITTLEDALWWAASTVTTVGYGDVVPTTAAGRGVSLFLSLVGLGVVALLTANIAAFFLEGSATATTAEPTELVERLDRIERRLDELAQRP